jgi:hypothetical protein
VPLPDGGSPAVSSAEWHISLYGAAPELYTPELPAVASQPEVRLLQEIANVSRLATISDTLQMHRPGIELGQYLNAYSQTLSPPLVPFRHTPTILGLAALTGLQLVFMWVLPYCCYLIKTWFPARTPIATPDTPEAATSTSPSTSDAPATDPEPHPRYLRYCPSAREC